MKILLSGGEKTENIVKGVGGKYKERGDEFIVENYIDSIDDIYSRGEYFDRALITYQSINREGNIVDEDKLRERVNRLALKCAERSNKISYVFLVDAEELAIIVSEEILPILDRSVVVLKEPKYSVGFFMSLIDSDIKALPEEIVYKAKPTVTNSLSNLAQFDEEEEEDYELEDELEDKLDFEVTEEDLEDSFGSDSSFEEGNLGKEKELSDSEKDNNVFGNVDFSTFGNADFSSFGNTEDFGGVDFGDGDFGGVDFGDGDFDSSGDGFGGVDFDSSDVGFGGVDFGDGDFGDVDFGDGDFDSSGSFSSDDFGGTAEFGAEDLGISGDLEGNLSSSERFGVDFSDFTEETKELEEEEYSGFEQSEEHMEDKGSSDLCAFTEEKGSMVGIIGFEETNTPDIDNTDYSKYSNVSSSEEQVGFGFTDEVSQEFSKGEFIEEDNTNIATSFSINESNNSQMGIKLSRRDRKAAKRDKETIESIKKSLDPFASRGNSIVVTGCGGCGTSTLAYSLANTITKLGYTVLLIDMDTEGRTQNYISKLNYDSMEADGSNLMAAVNSTNGINNSVSLVKKGLYLLTMGIGADIAPVEELLHREKLTRFHNLCKTSANFIIYDVPFKSATTYLSDLTFMCDNLVVNVDSSNWGITKALLDICNIASEDMQETVFNRAQLVFNKFRGFDNILGKRYKDLKGITKVMDKKVLELVGEVTGLYFENMSVAGAIANDSRFDRGWYTKEHFSDTKECQSILVELLNNIVLNKK